MTEWSQRSLNVASEPCKSCPYRKDATIELWQKVEFEDLLKSEERFMGAIYGCHKYRFRPKTEVAMCAGWFLDQKKRGYPSIALRMSLMVSGLDADQIDALVTDGGHRLYSSVKAMCAANGVRKKSSARHLPVLGVSRETEVEDGSNGERRGRGR